MITLSIDDLLHNRLPATYYAAAHCIYRVRNGAAVLYVGKAARQSTQERLLQHLATEIDSDYFGQVSGPSALGQYVRAHAPASHNWQIDLLTLLDCQAYAMAGKAVKTIAQAERLIIQQQAPLLNRANSPVPVASVDVPRSRNAGAPRSLPDGAEPFLASRSANKHTCDTYRYALLRWQQFAEETGLTTASTPAPVSGLHAESLGDFYDWLLKAGLQNNTVRTFLASIKQYVFWLHETDQLPSGMQVEDLLRALERRAGPHTRHQPPVRRQADDSIGGLLNYYGELLQTLTADTPRARRQKLAYLRNQAILQTLYSTAGQASEVAALTRAQVAQALTGDQPQPPLLPVEIMGHGQRPRTIFLVPEAQAAIHAYLQARQTAGDAPPHGTDDALFVRHDRDHSAPISTKTIWQVVSQAARATLGPDTPGGTRRKVGPQQFRHLRAQHLQAAGMPLETLQAILGHASLLTTRQAYGRRPTAETIAQELEQFGRSPAAVTKGQP